MKGSNGYILKFYRFKLFKFASHKDVLCQLWLSLARFWFCKCIFDILLLSPFEKGMVHHLNKLGFSLPWDVLCWVRLKLVQWFFIFRQWCFLFIIISPRKRVWPFTLTNLNFFHPIIFCAKFFWGLPNGSVEENENY